MHSVPSHQMTTRVAKCYTKNCIFVAIMALGKSGIDVSVHKSVIYAWNILPFNNVFSIIWLSFKHSLRKAESNCCVFFHNEQLHVDKAEQKIVHGRHYFSGMKQLLNLMHKCFRQRFSFQTTRKKKINESIEKKPGKNLTREREREKNWP